MNVLFEGSANLFRGIEGVGGKLRLGTEFLLFEPHAINVQKGQETIALKDITRVSKTNTLGLIPNGLSVKTAEHEFRFVVNKRSQWLARIIQQIEQLQAAETPHPTIQEQKQH